MGWSRRGHCAMEAAAGAHAYKIDEAEYEKDDHGDASGSPSQDRSYWEFGPSRSSRRRDGGVRRERAGVRSRCVADGVLGEVEEDEGS